MSKLSKFLFEWNPKEPFRNKSYNAKSSCVRGRESTDKVADPQDIFHILHSPLVGGFMLICYYGFTHWITLWIIPTRVWIPINPFSLSPRKNRVRGFCFLSSSEIGYADSFAQIVPKGSLCHFRDRRCLCPNRLLQWYHQSLLLLHGVEPEFTATLGKIVQFVFMM